MYCYVIFGASDNHHTKRYLYRCDELIPGDTVVVPVKKSEKIALVHSVMECIPGELDLKESNIKNVFGINTEAIENGNAISYILAMIDEYKDGNISKEIFYNIIEYFVGVNKLDIPTESELYSDIWSRLPDACTFYIDEPGEYSEKELGFWKDLKDIEYILRYGYPFWSSSSECSGKIKIDLVEYTDAYLKIELELERLIRSEIGEGGYMGFCHKYWRTKKKISRDKFGLDWKSPEDLNSKVLFD